MKKIKILWYPAILLLLASLVGCQQKRYAITDIRTSRIEIDASWEEKTNPQMQELADSYKSALGSQMDVEIGTAVRTMKKGRPQSLLGNFTADALKQKAEELWGDIDFAIVNTGGLRSTLNKGSVSVGNLYEIYSFDNALVLLELPASETNKFFKHIASVGGQAISNNIEMVVDGRKLSSLKIGGRELDPNKTYRVATIDYLAEGNDGMTAFKKASKRIDSGITLRDIMIEHVKKLTAENKEIDAKLDNRITLNP